MGELKTKYQPDEKDNFINKVMGKVVVVLAFLQILSPLVTSLLCLVGIEVDMPNVMVLIMMTYLIVEILNFSFNFIFFRWKKPSVFKCLAIGAILWLVLTTIINVSFNYHFIFYLFYIALFCMFVKIDKKYYKAMIYTFVIGMIVCAIMGLVDPYNKFMPGLATGVYASMSLQFTHPNYSAYVLVLAIFAGLYAVINYKKIYEQIVFWTCLVVLGFALFVNGTYGAEFAMFVALVVMAVWLWINNKKCPWQCLVVFGIMFVSIFTSQLYPNLRELSIATSNFIWETLSVVDNLLGTSLLEFFSRLVYGAGNELTFIAGSDGWGRSELLRNCIEACVASPKAFLFGYGSGYNNIVLVHDVYLRIWLETGFLGMCIYTAIIVYAAIVFVKNLKTNNQIFAFVVFMAFVLIIHNLGSLESYSYPYFIMLFAMLYKSCKGIKTDSAGINNEISEQQDSDKSQVKAN